MLQFTWQPYTADRLASLPAICTESAHLWSSRTFLICWEVVEAYYPDRVMRQFGMYQVIPADTAYDQTLHRHGQRGNWSKDWRNEHALYLQHWQRRGDTIFTFAPGPLCSPDYMPWFRRITMWIIGNSELRPAQSFGHQPSGSASEIAVRLFFNSLLNI